VRCKPLKLPQSRAWLPDCRCRYVWARLSERCFRSLRFRFASGIEQTSLDLLCKCVVAEYSRVAAHRTRTKVFSSFNNKIIECAPTCTTPLRHRSVSHLLQRNVSKEARKHCRERNGSTRSKRSKRPVSKGKKLALTLHQKLSAHKSGSFLKSPQNSTSSSVQARSISVPLNPPSSGKVDSRQTASKNKRLFEEAPPLGYQSAGQSVSQSASQPVSQSVGQSVKTRQQPLS
jgi:hypothetical protein